MVGAPAQRAPSEKLVADFGAELRRLRRARGMSLTVLAGRAHYSRGQLSKVENGRVRPTRELADACDKALDAGGLLSRLAAPRTPPKVRLPLAAGRQVDLPPATGIFVGRAKELTFIASLLSVEPPAATRIVVIHGAPGSGKTQLAIQAAQRLLDRYADGCVFIDLHAADIFIDAHSATERLLRRLGVPAATIPTDPAERAALYRHVMRDRRLLLVLDNAASAVDVSALVPPGGRSDLLVTNHIPLHAIDEAVVVRIGALDQADARELFVRIARDRLAPGADPTAIDRITSACARLPLAIRIAAARFRASRRLTLVGLARRLESPDLSLPTLDDGTRNVTRMFADACSALPPAQARLFALLSVHPGDTFDAWAASVLAGSTVGEAEVALDGLLDACLVEPAAVARYTFHNLVRAAAAHQAETTLPTGDIGTARARLLTCYLALAQRADVMMTPSRHRDRRVLPPDDRIESPFDTAEAAGAWLETEQDTLVRLVHLARDQGEHDACWKLAYALRDHFFRTNASSAWTHTHAAALAAARASGDTWAVAVTLNNLGLAFALNQDGAAADQHYAEALDLFRGLNDSYGEANALGHFAWTAYLRGDYVEARDRAVEALTIYRQRRERRNVGITLRTLGLISHALGRTQEAVGHLHEAVDLFVERGLTLDEAMALNALGEVTGPQDTPGSLRYHIRAWWRARACGSLAEQVRALRGMAQAAATVGRTASAARLSTYAARLSDREEGTGS